MQGRKRRQPVRGLLVSQGTGGGEEGGLVTQFLWIPGRIPGLNDILRAKRRLFGKGKNKADGYSQLKAAWGQRIKLYALAQRIKPIDRAAFSYLFVEQDRRRDPSNLLTSIKLAEDGLQEAGLLPNDGWSNVLGIELHWMVGSPIGVMVGCGETAPGRDELIAAHQRVAMDRRSA
jgi:hypothetical protein